MIKKSLAVLSIAVVFYVQAQDVSVIRNSVDVYSSNVDGSSKYNSMAGSMGALGGDVSVLNTNPAGIGVSIASDFSGTLSINSSENTASLNNQSYSYKLNNTDLGQVGGIAVFEVGGNSNWKFVNLGVTYSNKSVEDYVESPANNNISYTLTDTESLVYNGHAYNRLGDRSKMSIGVGANYNNNLYFGVGINIHSASLNQYDSADLYYTSDSYHEIFNKQNTQYWEDASGFSANIGVIGKVNNMFRVGAAIETPTWWSIDRVYQNYGVDGYDQEYSESRNLSSPFKGTLSAAFVPNKSFAINVDYTTELSKPKYKSDDAGAETEFENFYDNNYKNISEVKIGAEYRIQAFRLRGGYGFATSPFGDNITMDVINSAGNSESQSFDDLYVGKRNTIGAGLGYDFKSFYIDAAYQNVQSEYSNPFLKGSANAETGYFSSNAYVTSDASVVSKVKNTQNNFFITLGWKF